MGSKTLAAQDFRHATQGSQESVADYILRLEKTFRRAYGSDPMGEETRNALLYAQLQEGLKYVLMKAPAVSGAQEYKELCVAAKNEEWRLVELSKRQQFLRDSVPETSSDQRHGRQFGQYRMQRGGDNNGLPSTALVFLQRNQPTLRVIKSDVIFVIVQVILLINIETLRQRVQGSK